MKRSIPTLLVTLTLVACGSSTPSGDAGVDVPVDVPADRPDVLDVTADVPPPLDVRVDAEPFCDVPATYTYGLDGGIVPTRDVVTLAPGRSFTFRRTPFGLLDAGACNCSCTTMLDYCGTSDGGTLDTLAVINAFNDRDVMAAFADQSVTLYGRDTRPVDGQVFAVTRGDGRHFEIGYDCNGASGCREVPAGLTRLRAVLTALQTQELRRPACAALGT